MMEKIKLVRTSLKDQVIDILYNRILSGEMPPGTRLVERDIAEALGISRMPVRDALFYLEAQGVVVTNANGRSVVDLSWEKLLNLYQVRVVLELLAVDLASKSCTGAMRTALRGCLSDFRQAVEDGEVLSINRADENLHKVIWEFSGNPHLVKIMNSLVGPMFMFSALHAQDFDWKFALTMHEALIEEILRGDAAAARATMQRHLDNFLNRVQQIVN